MEFMKRVQTYIVKNFCERFKSIPVSIVAALVLHPGYSKMTFLEESEKQAAQDFIIAEMMKLHTISVIETPGNAQDANVAASLSGDSDSADEMLRELQGVTEVKVYDATSINEAEAHTSLKLQCLSEFKTYLDVARTYLGDKSTKQCPLEWWKCN